VGLICSIWLTIVCAATWEFSLFGKGSIQCSSLAKIHTYAYGLTC